MSDDDDATKATNFIKELRAMMDTLREKYGVDWCDRHTVIIGCGTPLDSTEPKGTYGLAACVTGSNVMIEELMACAVTRLGKAYEEGLGLPPEMGNLVALDHVRKNIDCLSEGEIFGPPGSKGEKGYRIAD
jgi:hypothetical protein